MVVASSSLKQACSPQLDLLEQVSVREERWPVHYCFCMLSLERAVWVMQSSCCTLELPHSGTAGTDVPLTLRLLRTHHAHTVAE